jgi:hypothetical protein
MSAINTLPPPSNVLPPQEHDGFLALPPIVERHARVRAERGRGSFRE